MKNEILEIKRVAPSWRDILFPIYSLSQFLFLLALCLVGFCIAALNHASPIFFFICAWVGGSVSLWAAAPGVLSVPETHILEVEELLRQRNFKISPDGRVWAQKSIPAWLQWENSDIVVELHHEVTILKGPLSTLRALRNAAAKMAKREV
jgi:hypothetical protein